MEEIETLSFAFYTSIIASLVLLIIHHRLRFYYILNNIINFNFINDIFYFNYNYIYCNLTSN